MARIDTFLEMVAKQNASDLHFVSGSPPILRLHGQMERIKFRTLTHEEVQTFIYEIMTEDQKKTFEELHDADFAYQIEGIARFRVNAFMQRYGMGAVFRQNCRIIFRAPQSVQESERQQLDIRRNQRRFEADIQICLAHQRPVRIDSQRLGDK